MSRIALEPNSSGSGVFTISSPNSNTSRTLNLPDAAGTVSVADSNGIISANGIAFPATQSASANVNTLDDYEEGTWTPTDASGAGLTFVAATGTYIKVGRQVTAWALVEYPSTANGSNASIGSFPFTPQNTDSVRGGGMIGQKSESTLQTVLMSKTGTTCDLRNSTGGNITNATMSTDNMFFAITYFTA
jgi:hypothetical protein